MSSSFSVSTYTRAKRLMNDRGRPLRPPPSSSGFWHAKIWKDGGHWNSLSISGMYTVARWSRQLFRPSSTCCEARFSSSSRIHAPLLIPLSSTPSLQRNCTALPFSSCVCSPAGTGRSEPNRSAMSVCSERLMRTMGCPITCAIAMMRDVLPTPGEPSRRMGLCSCSARSTRLRLEHVVGASKW